LKIGSEGALEIHQEVGVELEGCPTLEKRFVVHTKGEVLFVGPTLAITIVDVG